MSDICDIAADNEMIQREAAIMAIRARPTFGASTGLCEDCDAEIPGERLRAVPGCVRCVHCQMRWERR